MLAELLERTLTFLVGSSDGGAANLRAVDDVHDAPVRDARYRKPCQLCERRVVIQQLAEDPAGLGEKAHLTLFLNRLAKEERVVDCCSCAPCEIQCDREIGLAVAAAGLRGDER